jgi:hypothetical protein
LIAAFGLLMLELSAYFALIQIWSAISASAILGAVNFVIAAILFAIAAKPPAGRELELATQIHDSSIDALQNEARALQSHMSGVIHHPLNGIFPLMIVPLIRIIIKSLKKPATTLAPRQNRNDRGPHAGVIRQRQIASCVRVCAGAVFSIFEGRSRRSNHAGYRNATRADVAVPPGFLGCIHASNYSIYNADRATHLKIVVVVALVAGIGVASLGIAAHASRDDGYSSTAPIIKVGQPSFQAEGSSSRPPGQAFCPA